MAAYFTFNGAWNSFLWPMIVLGTQSKKAPLSVMMYWFAREFSRRPMHEVENPLEPVGWPALMALSIIETLPVFIMFLFCREYLMKGIKLRGFK